MVNLCSLSSEVTKNLTKRQGKEREELANVIRGENGNRCGKSRAKQKGNKEQLRRGRE